MEGAQSHNKAYDGLSPEEEEDARKRLAKAKADLAELEVEIEKRSKMDLSLVQAFIGSEVATFKRELLGLPRGLPNEIYGLDQEAIRTRLRGIFDNMLNESDERFNYSALIEFMDT